MTNFKKWLRKVFGPWMQRSRASRRAKSRQLSRNRWVPRLELLEDRLAPAILMVNSVADSSLASLAGDGKLELREAIQLATHPGTTIDGYTTNDTNNTIEFSPSIDGQTIDLTTDVNETVPPLNGDAEPGPTAFVIRGVTLTIDGETGLTQGITIKRDAEADPFRLFYVNSSANLTLKGLTLSDGLAQGFDGVSNGGAGGGGAAGLGGAVFNEGLLTIQDSTLTGNTAKGGAGAQGGKTDGGGGGGGLATSGYTGREINNPLPSGYNAYGIGGDGGGPNGGFGGSQSTGVKANGTPGQFGGGGGGGYGFGGFQTFGVPFSGAGGNGGFGGGGGGGGSGNVGINGSPGGTGGFGGGGGGGGNSQYGGAAGGFGGGYGVNNNGGGGAGMGGAIFTRTGTVTITNSTLTANTALGGTGGTGGTGLGGALFNYNGTFLITNSTISSNTAAQGQSVYILGNGNTPANAIINNTIIGERVAGASDLVVNQINGGSATISGVTNLISTLVVDNNATNNMAPPLTGDPMLGPLHDNGGLTPTMALQSGSPALHYGTKDLAPTTDQRGGVRDILDAGTVDIGAYEAPPGALDMIVNTAADNTTADDFLSLREALELTEGTLNHVLFPGEAAQVHTATGNVSTITFASTLDGKTITLSTASDGEVGPSAFLVGQNVVIDGPSGNAGVTLQVASGTPMRFFNVTSSGQLTLENLTLSGGTAQGSTGLAGLGGAIYSTRGKVTILNSTLTGNTAQGGAGGAGFGGAIFNYMGNVYITNSTFYGNSAIGATSAAPGEGGGLFNVDGFIMVNDSTFSGNTTVQGDGSTLVAAGSGIYNLGNNATATAIINNTIIGQADTTVQDFTGASIGSGADTTSGSGDLIRTQSGFAGTIVSSADPDLETTLQDNGGPTPTLALQAGSPAIDAGSNSAIPAGVTTDQRGQPRIYNGAVDIGAYEFRPIYNMVVNTTANAIDNTDGKLSLREAIGLADGTLSFDALSPQEQNQVHTASGFVNTITFDSSVYGHTVLLSTVGDSSFGPSAFMVDSNIIIDGPSGNSGVTIARDTNAADYPNQQVLNFRLFDVTSAGSLTLENLTLSGGLAQGFAGGDSDNGGAGGGGAGLGGAIFNQGALTILNSTLTNNTAQGGQGGGFSNSLTVELGQGGAGGAGMAGPGTASSGVDGSSGGGPSGSAGGTSDNPHGAGDGSGYGGGGGGASGGGGGASGGGGGASGGGGGASGGGVAANAGGGGMGGFGAGGGGGGGYFGGIGGKGGFGGGGGGGGGIGGGVGNGFGGGSSYGGGTGGASSPNGGTGGGGAGIGGAIFNEAGAVLITNSTITGNSAIGGAAGAAGAGMNAGYAGEGLGGGLFNHDGAITLTSCTFTENTAANGGRQIGMVTGPNLATLTANINNTIIAQSDSNGTDLQYNKVGNGSTIALSGQGNLIGTWDIRESQTSILFLGGMRNTDPKLDPQGLSDNGGPTQTIALMTGSPALNAGSNAAAVDSSGNPLTTDQRGDPRISNGTVDIGAFEFSVLTGSTAATATGGVEGLSPATLSNATFTDATTSAPLSDFTITGANWGDGSTDTSSLTVSGSNGNYTVNGSHLYAADGTYSFSITVTDASGDSATITGTTIVSEASLTGSSAATATGGVERRSPATLSNASFTDANTGASSSDFRITAVTWGDGDSNPAGLTVSGSNGNYRVNGSHVYLEEGTYNFSITVTDDGGNTATITGSATVADATLTGSSAATAINGVEELTAATLSHANFNDAPTGNLASDFTVTAVSWGDGSTDATGLTVVGSSGNYSIAGSHMYAESGTYNFSITVTDDGGSTAIITGSATVADANLSVSSAATATGGIEGAMAATLSNANFTDANKDAAASDFTVTAANWGDGTTATIGLNVSGSNGTYTVNGAHMYTEEGTYNFSISVQDASGTSATITGSTTVGDATLTGGSDATATGVANTVPATVTNATFTDANTGASSSDFTVTAVTWGDGNTSTNGLTVSGSNGNYAVNGAHLYAKAGTYNFSIAVTDAGGNTTTITGSTTVSGTPSDPSAQQITAGGNATFTIGVADNAQGIQWQVSTDGGATFTNVTDGGYYSGSTTTTLSVMSALTNLNMNLYRAVITYTGNVTLTTNSAQLTVTSGYAYWAYITAYDQLAWATDLYNSTGDSNAYLAYTNASSSFYYAYYAYYYNAIGNQAASNSCAYYAESFAYQSAYYSSIYYIETGSQMAYNAWYYGFSDFLDSYQAAIGY